MKSTGIVRKVDELGRIVIPKEVRTVLGIEIRDPLEIFTNDNMIILRKYITGCHVCGNMEDLKSVKNITLCSNCISEFNKE